jgi:hypothetical protein
MSTPSHHSTPSSSHWCHRKKSHHVLLFFRITECSCKGHAFRTQLGCFCQRISFASLKTINNATVAGQEGGGCGWIFSTSQSYHDTFRWAACMQLRLTTTGTLGLDKACITSTHLAPTSKATAAASHLLHWKCCNGLQPNQGHRGMQPPPPPL